MQEHLGRGATGPQGPAACGKLPHAGSAFQSNPPRACLPQPCPPPPDNAKGRVTCGASHTDQAAPGTGDSSLGHVSADAERRAPESQRGSPFPAGREAPQLPLWPDRSETQLSLVPSANSALSAAPQHERAALYLRSRNKGCPQQEPQEGPPQRRGPRPPHHPGEPPQLRLHTAASPRCWRPGTPPARGPTRPSTPGSHGPLPDAGLPPSTQSHLSRHPPPQQRG